MNAEQELFSMLAMRRPAGSKTERRFIREHLAPLGLTQDSFGNLYIRIGDAPIMWSSHTDTVHKQGGMQLLAVSDGIVSVPDKQSNCLGADCTAGVWLMVQMIRAGKPGLYIFHRAEEIGGQGSEHIASCNEALLAGILYAVAFDRRGTQSIITHQWGGRCCSATFARSLSAALGMGHGLDDGGSFTDTANYTHLIGECTNLSVGYAHEHSRQETLNLPYLYRLRDALLAFDWTALDYEREPWDTADDEWRKELDDWADDNEQRFGYRSMAGLLRDHPNEVADWLEEYGITPDEVATAIYMRGGVIRR
jgi:hypothetical protein